MFLPEFDSRSNAFYFNNMGTCLGANFFVFLVLGLISIQGCSSVKKKPLELSSSERARMFVEVANAALLEGDPTGALQSLAEAEKIDSSLPELHHSFALAYFRKHELKRAIQYARRAVELKPDYPEANNTLGKLLMEDGKLVEARAPLERAAHSPLSRETYKAWTNLGIIHYRLGDLKESEKLMDLAIENAPVVACAAYYYRGQIKLRNNQVNSAILDYDRATRKVCAGFGDAYLALGMAYEQNKQYELARKVFLDVEKRFPNTKIAEQATDRVRFLP